jgi:hypothetical protein
MEYYDPSVFATANKPDVALLTPQQKQANVNALALQNQSVQGGALDLQAKQQALLDQQNTQAAMQRMYGGNGAPTQANALAAAPAGPAPAVAPPPGAVDPVTGQPFLAPPPGGAPAAPPPGGAPGGAPPAAAAPPVAVPPRPKVPTVGALISQGVPYERAQAIVENYQKIDKGGADIDKANADAEKATNETNKLVQGQISDMANAVIQAGGSSAVMNWSLQHFASYGPKFAAAAQQIQQKYAALPPDQQQLFLKSLVQSPETLTAQAKVTDAGLATDKAADEKAAKKESNAYAFIGSTKDQKSYADAFSRAPQSVQANLTPPAQWTPAASALALQKGLTADQQVTSAQSAATLAETAKRDAATAKNEQTARAQEQQNINLRLKAFNQQYGDPTEGATPAEITTAKMRAAGAAPLPSTRSKGYDRELALAVSQDPTFAQFAGTRADTIKNFVEKKDADSIVRLSTALSHLDRFKLNSANLGTEPSLALNVTPGQHALHQDIINVSDEIGTLVKNGPLAEGESNKQQANLTSVFQSSRDAAADELKHLMAGKVQAIVQKYKSGTGMDLPAAKYFNKETRGRLKEQGLTDGIDMTEPGAPAAAPVAAPVAGAAAPAARVHDVPELGAKFNGGTITKVTRIP